MRCDICANSMRPAFYARVLEKCDARYFVCDSCGYLSTEAPFWLEEAYTTAIAGTDVGIVRRNIVNVRRLAPLLYYLFRGQGKFLDIGGGYGLLTRMMRDIGFDYYWYDPYCENIFASGYGGTSNSEYDAISAFELLEHLQHPMDFMVDLMRKYRPQVVVLSTELYSGEVPRIDAWPYYALETGQHVSFFTRGTLEEMARRLSLYLSSRSDLHLLTRRPIAKAVFETLTNGRVAHALAYLVERRLGSKTQRDFEQRRREYAATRRSIEGPARS